MAAFPRTSVDTPVADPMAGWSEDRKRFFIRMGYDRGPDPVSFEQGGLLMGEGNILQRRRNPEVNVKITETPPDDPTPTKKVTSIKYPTEPPYMGAEEQWGAQAGLPVSPAAAVTGGGPIVSEPMLTAPGTFEGSRRSPPVSAGMLDTGEGVVSQSPEALFGPQETIAGAPETSRIDRTRMLLAQQGQQVWHIDEETGEQVTVQDIMDAQDENLALGPMAGSVRVSFNVLKAMDKAQRTRYWEYIKNFVRGKGKRKGTKPAAQAGSKIDYTTGFTGKQLERARAQQRLLQNAETAALIGTGVAGGTAAGLLGQPEEEGPYYEGYSPVLEEGRGASPADAAATTAAAIGEDYQGILDEKQERMELGPTFAQELARDPDRLGLEEQKAFDASQAEVARVAAQDAASKQAELDRYYANFPEDIEGKRNRYLKALKEIYKKVAILNVIAALTNSQSQAGAFMQMAAEKFKTLEGFRGEERLQKIARGVFFKENGEFDAPASKQDAFDRAIRFGANHEEALELSGHKKEYAPTTTAHPGFQIWSNESTGQQTYLLKGEVPPGEGWLPKAAPTEGKGTEFERMTLRASKLIGAGNIEQAVSLLSFYLLGKDSMLRDFIGAAEADTIARAMVERLSKQLDVDPVSLAKELGILEGGQGVTTAQPSNPRRPS